MEEQGWLKLIFNSFFTTAEVELLDTEEASNLVSDFETFGFGWSSSSDDKTMHSSDLFPFFDFRFWIAGEFVTFFTCFFLITLIY